MYETKDISDCMPHFIFCTQHDDVGSFRFAESLKDIFKRKMEQYQIESIYLTVLYMDRKNLITKEKQKQAYSGKLKNDEEWKQYEGSINDDLESFLNSLSNGIEIKEEIVESFLIPKLTKEELKLVEEKDREHMKTYKWDLKADVDVEEMKKSDSKDKFVHCWCRRETYHLTVEADSWRKWYDEQGIARDWF